MRPHAISRLDPSVIMAIISRLHSTRHSRRTLVSMMLAKSAPSLPKSLCEASIAARTAEAALRPSREDTSKDPASMPFISSKISRNDRMYSNRSISSFEPT